MEGVLGVEMGMQGNLQDMGIPDLIQLTCQDQKTAMLVVQSDGAEASLYFQNGEVVHAAMDDEVGEEVVYKILDWNEGTFNLETGVQAETKSITRSWTSLLLEGARRLDESRNENEQEEKLQKEVQKMSKLDELLAEMGKEISGYIASAVVGIDGINVASHTTNPDADPDVISAQMTKLFKLVDSTVEKMGAGTLEDNLITMERAYILMRFLPDTKDYYLGMAADTKKGKLGNMRLISKIYTQKIAKAMPK